MRQNQKRKQTPNSAQYGLDIIFKPKYFIKAIEYFFRVHIASSKQLDGWENCRKLCKFSTASQVSIQLFKSKISKHICAILRRKQRC